MTCGMIRLLPDVRLVAATGGEVKTARHVGSRAGPERRSFRGQVGEELGQGVVSQCEGYLVPMRTSLVRALETAELDGAVAVQHGLIVEHVVAALARRLASQQGHAARLVHLNQLERLQQACHAFRDTSSLLPEG